MNSRLAIVASILFLALSDGSAFAAARIRVENLDVNSGKGFDDPAPRRAIGGNTGTTLGAQRLIAFQHAADIWGNALSSAVEIVIDATMTTPLPCDDSGATLGQAAPTSAVLTASPRQGGQMLMHPIALANALAGQDLDPTGSDVTAQFNPSVDEGCTSSSWYYGLDGMSGPSPDFFPTVLHELGHGLGFIFFTDPSSGDFLDGSPDVFSAFAFDTMAGKAWIDMTGPERVASQGHARNLVWTGPNTTREAPTFLEPGFPVLDVSPALAGLFGRLSEEVAGPYVTRNGVTGTLMMPAPPDGCTNPTNAADLQGGIVLVAPISGGAQCSEIQAVVDMEALGAKAVISIDPQGFDPPMQILGEYKPQVIPAVQVGTHDGDLLKTAIGGEVTLKPGPNLAGADPDGRLFLYASDPYLAGSSVGHWDPAARRDLLMEPNDTSDVSEIDITRYFMQDIGWPVCGDKAVQAAEECDDGNLDDRDGCSSSCKKEVCGDGTVNQTTEKCDDGNTTSNDGCSATCQPEVCGDGTVNQTTEKCDDGNTTSNDGCSATCQPEVCGDRTVNQASEKCDDGNTTSNDGCSATCQPEVCGDGTVNQTTEKCDDGNTTSNDGCSATCQPEVCGDGTVNQASEKCDDGNTTSNDGCSATCQPEVCGDGTVNQTTEKCDDGNKTRGDGCENDCTVTPRSGAGGAATAADGGPSTEGNHPRSDSGCGCRVAGEGSEPFGGAGAVIALLVAFGSRRRGSSWVPE